MAKVNVSKKNADILSLATSLNAAGREGGEGARRSGERARARDRERAREREKERGRERT